MGVGSLGPGPIGRQLKPEDKLCIKLKTLKNINFNHQKVLVPLSTPSEHPFTAVICYAVAVE